MKRYEGKQRSLNACLIAAIVHLSLAILLTFFYYSHLSSEIDDVVGIEFVEMEETIRKHRTIKRPPKKNPTQKSKAISEYRPQHKALSASSNLFDETVRPSEKILTHSATETVSKTTTELPDVTTQAKHLNSRAAAIAKSVQSPYEITSGKGKESLRQRVKGEGESGFHRLDSKGTSDIGGIGDGIGQDGSGGGDGTADGGDGKNPFGDALKRIADHIISIRTADKVNVVFVLDTSASMQNNIQQVADNLYSMTDAFDTINLEYHLGMSEFSVREHGQEIKTRALLPDVAVLKRRMKEVKLSGDENALDALYETFNFIEFHADADKHLILVTDEQATTSLRKKGAKEEMREKVLDQTKFEEVHVNVLGVPEPFQQQLAELTGGIWQAIPGSEYNAAALPSNRAGNQKFLKVFRDIATEIRKSGGKPLFSLDLKHTINLEEGQFSVDQIKKVVRDNGLNFKPQLFLSENVNILNNLISELWVIADYENGEMFSVNRDETKVYVYGGVLPEQWNLDEDAIARTQTQGKRWVLTNLAKNQIYTFIRGDDHLQVFAGGQPGSASNPNAEPIVDIMIMLDYSRSMGGKSQAIMLGLSTLLGRLDIFSLKYRIGLIRFAEAKDAIKSIDGVVVTQMPLNEVIIGTLMENPFGGDEHLIDAIVEGLPQVKFSPFAKRFLLILTDEPTTGKYPAEQALKMCKSYGITAYVVGHPQEDDFQTKLAKETWGSFFTMPKHLDKEYLNQ